MSKISFKMMLDNCEPDDAAQLHDILTMMSEVIDEQQDKIKRLESQMKRVNEAMPSTAILKAGR